MCQVSTAEFNIDDKWSKEEEDEFMDDCLMDKCGLVPNPSKRPKHLDENIELPKYVGCYIDNSAMDEDGKAISDLDTRLKGIESVRDCFDRAKELGYEYVGLQNGGECWASFKYGKQGRAPDSQCNYICDYDKGYVCGGENRNTIWDISKYNGNETDQPLCKTKIYHPKNCS